MNAPRSRANGKVMASNVTFPIMFGKKSLNDPINKTNHDTRVTITGHAITQIL